MWPAPVPSPHVSHFLRVGNEQSSLRSPFRGQVGNCLPFLPLPYVLFLRSMSFSSSSHTSQQLPQFLKIHAHYQCVSSDVFGILKNISHATFFEIERTLTAMKFILTTWRRAREEMKIWIFFSLSRHACPRIDNSRHRKRSIEMGRSLQMEINCHTSHTIRLPLFSLTAHFEAVWIRETKYWATKRRLKSNASRHLKSIPEIVAH